MKLVDMMRYRDKDEYGGNREDDGEDRAGLIPATIATLPALHLLPLTYLLQPILTVIQFYIILILILILILMIILIIFDIFVIKIIIMLDCIEIYPFRI